MNILKSLVEQYMKDQWYNYRKSLNFYEAREELLSGATIHFYKPSTTYPTDTWKDEEKTTWNCNPVMADSHGEFPPICLDGDYKIEVQDRNGMTLLTADNLKVKGWLE